jgi:membrane glycosyltransferase
MNVATLHTTAPAPHAPGCVPPEAPLAMPAQALRKYERGRRVRPSIANRLARLLTFAGSWAVTGFGVWEMYRVVQLGGVTPLEWMMVGVFAVTFGWIALSAT